MAEYQVVLARLAERDILKLPFQIQKRIELAIDRLCMNPRPGGVKKLKGGSGLWRIRVGDYRVIYRIDDSKRLVDISHIRHRKEAYE